MKTPTTTRAGTGPRQLGLSAALALFTLSVLPASAGTMTFTATGDNTMLNGLANDNYGNFNLIAAGAVADFIPNQISVLRFDVSALDGLYSSIDSVTLRLYYHANGGDGTAAVTTNVHAISAANRAWIEGTHQGAAATGESTWNNLAHSSTPWAGSAGLGTAGTDYDSTVLATYTLPGPWVDRPAAGTAIDFTFTGSSATLTALINSWMVDNVTNSQDNPGLLLRDPTPTIGNLRNRFTATSTENANAALHPQLIVEYSRSPSASDFSVIITPSVGSPGHYDFEWNSQTGKVYDLVSSTDLSTAPASWQVYDPDGPGGNPPFGDIPSAGVTTTLTAVPSADPRRFFAMREKDGSPD